jgi:hypothetical protein
MIIPDYGVSASGYDEIWGVRESMGNFSLSPHATDSHTLPEPHVMKCYTYLTNITTGELQQYSSCTFTFDSKDEYVLKYYQENLYLV